MSKKSHIVLLMIIKYASKILEIFAIKVVITLFAI